MTIESMAQGDSPLHRVDPRGKVLASFLLVFSAAALPPGDLLGPALHLLLPVTLGAIGGIPFRPLLVRLALVSPFVIAVGIWAPLIERQPVEIGLGLSLSSGWLIFGSILLRFVAVVGALLVLSASTPLADIARSANFFGVPRALTAVTMLVYRYFYLLLGQFKTMLRAFHLRGGARFPPLSLWGAMAGNLLTRTLKRARSVQLAMELRGFTGEFPTPELRRFTGSAVALVVLTVIYTTAVHLFVRGVLPI